MEDMASHETPSPLDRIITKLGDEFFRAYVQEQMTSASGEVSARAGSYYRISTQPMHGKEFTRNCAVIVRKRPHPYDQSNSFTEIYAPLDPKLASMEYSELNVLGSKNSQFIMHIRRQKDGRQVDHWVAIDKAGITRLEDLDSVDIDLAVAEDHSDHAQRCAEKLLNLMSRESLIASSATEFHTPLH